MPWSDFLLVFQWWGTLFLVGAAAYPLTRRLGLGYSFSKAVGMAVVAYIIFLSATLHIVPFTQGAIWAAMGVLFIFGVLVNRGNKGNRGNRGVIWEEIFFMGALLLWTWVKGHEPSIHGLEKFMDFGFTKSILNSRYFPAPDMWYAGSSINYYYFGHTVMAVLTKLSGIDLAYTFNLMLATIFALCATMSFAIGKKLTTIWGGILTAFLVTLAGNMQTIYAFTKGYDGDAVKPFWELLGKMDFTRYWYANATRFIPYTIHEFPSYSFVVSDVHGHVLSIPFVLLAIALLLQKKKSPIFYGFLCGVLLMTNALDGPIYLGLFMIISYWGTNGDWGNWGRKVGIAVGAAALASIPFLLHFHSFVNGIAVNCPLSFLANTKIGPLLFEGVEKCQHSPFWMWWILWGFFVYCGVWLFFKKIHQPILQIFFLFSLVLLIFPEFFYFKDIYPMHFRSNTMFKLGYQAFIMLSIVSAYAIVKLKTNKLFLLFLLPQLFLVSIYPIFSVRSYFNSLKAYEGIHGLAWFARQYPDDWSAIQWLNLRSTTYDLSPVIVEADGDSYTDYDRVSAFTGLPTIIGWPVHEWLWRGSYDVVAPRREEVRTIYESADMAETKAILAKYHVTYIVVGTLEREKFKNLQEEKFSVLGSPVFTRGGTVIYQVR